MPIDFSFLRNGSISFSFNMIADKTINYNGKMPKEVNIEDGKTVEQKMQRHYKIKSPLLRALLL